MRPVTTDKLVHVKQLFFDRAAVTRRLDPATRKVLGKFGALVRKTARWSIRRRKGPSNPGEPPHNQTGLLKKFIFYSYDPLRESVVIGPAKLNGTKGVDVPSVLEYGGVSVIGDGGFLGPKRRVEIAARPYMRPAYEKTEKELPALWRDSVKA